MFGIITTTFVLTVFLSKFFKRKAVLVLASVAMLVVAGFFLKVR